MPTALRIKASVEDVRLLTTFVQTKGAAGKGALLRLGGSSGGAAWAPGQAVVYHAKGGEIPLSVLDAGRPLLYPNISAAFEVWGCLLAPGQSFRSYVGTLTASHVSNAYPNLKTASGCEQLRCLPVKLRISRPDAIVEHFISNLEAESVRWPRAGVEYATRRIKVLTQAKSRLLTVRPGRARRGDGGNRVRSLHDPCY